MAAVSRCAQDGLLPDGREAAIVRFGDQATYMPMIGGFRKIAADYGWSLRTVPIFANDEFAYELGEHRRSCTGRRVCSTIAARWIGAYAIGVHSSGRREVEVMSAETSREGARRPRAKNSGPWVDWTARMYEKTVGRRLFAKLPLADHDRVQRVLQAEAVLPEDAAVALYGSRADVELEAGSDHFKGKAADAGPAEPMGEGRREQPSGRRAAAPAFAGEEPPEAPPADDVVALAGGERFDAGRYQGPRSPRCRRSARSASSISPGRSGAGTRAGQGGDHDLNAHHNQQEGSA
jgi:recombination protein RecT